MVPTLQKNYLGTLFALFFCRAWNKMGLVILTAQGSSISISIDGPVVHSVVLFGKKSIVLLLLFWVPPMRYVPTVLILTAEWLILACGSWPILLLSQRWFSTSSTKQEEVYSPSKPPQTTTFCFGPVVTKVEWPARALGKGGRVQLGTVGKVSMLERRRLLAWPPVRRTTVSSGSSSDAPGQISWEGKSGCIHDECLCSYIRTHHRIDKFLVVEYFPPWTSDTHGSGLESSFFVCQLFLWQVLWTPHCPQSYKPAQ